ncbi:SCF ubiquitin ligase complex subunit cdc4 [Desmophyllum pertusum]|uniref:SCF ubiquitin ligase complex subunit cdc4 n=1 Tax=Desmophyllum pertusum TaxID=174260 RepID=A0A9W9YG09_9CNID|nr:SCF ubiquitin ligase complex subunit cdc4 [Desmophyllum pertusum]
MNLSALPLELIDEILKRLDAISLAKSRQVCRSWRELHSQPRYKLLWRRACFRDITEDVLSELTGKRTSIVTHEDPDGLSGTSEIIRRENDSTDWKAVYQKWFRSRHIGKWPSMITELRGHAGSVWDVKFSGDRVVTCGEDGTICIWDSWTSHCIAVLSGHRDAVLSISLRQIPGLSPHADIPHDLIVSGSKDCSVKVWDMKTPCATAVLNGHCYHVLSNLGDWVKYVRLWQSDTLLYVTDNSQLGLWSIKYGESLSSIELTDTRRHNVIQLAPGVQGAAFRGNTALVLTHSNGLFAWENKSDSSILHNFSLIGEHSNSVERGDCLTMHGALVAIGTRSGAVHVYHLDGNWENQFTKVHCVLHGNKSAVNAVSIDDDGEGPSLITGGEDGIVRVYRWFPPSI